MRRFNAILLGLLAMDVVLVVALLLLVNGVAAAVTGISLVATVAVLLAILPRRYEVWPDRLRIVFAIRDWDIPYGSIDVVRAGRWYEAYGFAGLRFATAPSQTVTVLRHNANLLTHPNLVISPADRDEFLRQLERAMRE